MNRHERRKRFALGQKHVREYVEHLAEADFTELFKPGITHVVHYHDDWCDMMKGGIKCTCNPGIKFYRDPKRN